MDKYTISARFYPSIIVVFPLVVIGVSFSIDINKYYQILASLGISAALAYFISNLVRENGKKKENWLWNKWGGAPTSQLFSINNTTIDSISKKRIYSTMIELIPESASVITRNIENELNDLYKTWTKYLIAKTRDNKIYSLLFKENINYGFRRNLWSMKVVAVLILITVLVANYVIVAMKIGFIKILSYSMSFYISELILFVLLVIWLTLITTTWVQTQAFSYAERLIESISSVRSQEIKNEASNI
jgi:hypothetical protein